MRPHVLHRREADVQVADGRIGAVVEREKAAGHAAMEHTGGPSLDLPPEHVAIERRAGFDVVRGEINEDQGVRFHPVTIAKMD